MDEGLCNLEVDVNGEETFMVDKVFQIIFFVFFFVKCMFDITVDLLKYQ